MTTEQTYTLVFKDQAGEYYLLPQEALEQGRVLAEHKAEVERLVAEGEADDVAGHLVFALGFLTGVVVTGSMAVSVAALARKGTLNPGLTPYKP